MSNPKRLTVWLPVIIGVSVVAGIFIGGIFSGKNYLADSDRKLNTILNLIQQEYVDTVDIDELAVKIAKENADMPQQRKICVETNEVLGEYLDKVIAEKSQKQHPINFTMPMTLTDENILKNKEFFNQLFKKHGIDYNV